MTDEQGDGKRKKWRCCLCNKLTTGFGNNPEPLDLFENRCCDDCNRTQVVPYRLGQLSKGRNPWKLGEA